MAEPKIKYQKPKGWKDGGGLFWVADHIQYGLNRMCKYCGQKSMGDGSPLAHYRCSVVAGLPEGRRHRNPKTEGTFDLTKYHDSTTSKNLNYGVKNVEDFIESYGLDLHPEYQRDHVWTDDQASQYVGHVLQGGEAGTIYINPVPGTLDHEVVDGKQRLTAFLKWVQGRIPAVMYDGTEAWFEDLDVVSNRLLSLTITLKIGILELKTRAEILRFYLKLNKGGTVHTDEEIERVRKLYLEELKREEGR